MSGGEWESRARSKRYVRNKRRVGAEIMKLQTGVTLVEGNRVSRSCVPKQTLGTRVRGAFTLVEMLVATALVMFIMLILSEAFVAGLEAFRTLKGIGDMESRLKSAVTPIRDDLRQ